MQTYIFETLQQDHGLTGREAQIAIEVSKGLSNADVASSISIAEKTVKWHLTNIFKKMGVKSRYQLIFKCDGK